MPTVTVQGSAVVQSGTVADSGQFTDPRGNLSQTHLRKENELEALSRKSYKATRVVITQPDTVKPYIYPSEEGTRGRDRSH